MYLYQIMQASDSLHRCCCRVQAVHNESGLGVLAWLQRMKVVAGCKLQLLSAGLGADLNLPA